MFKQYTYIICTFSGVNAGQCKHWNLDTDKIPKLADDSTLFLTGYIDKGNQIIVLSFSIFRKLLFIKDVPYNYGVICYDKNYHQSIFWCMYASEI